MYKTADMTMDEYIDWLLSSSNDSTLQSVVRNILDEPIPKAVKERLLKPLLPRPVPPSRKRKLQKREALLQQFDPLYASTKRKVGVKNKTELLSLVKTSQNLSKPPQFVLLKEAVCEQFLNGTSAHYRLFSAKKG